jgi:hypothetical protein
VTVECFGSIYRAEALPIELEITDGRFEAADEDAQAIRPLDDAAPEARHCRIAVVEPVSGEARTLLDHSESHRAATEDWLAVFHFARRGVEPTSDDLHNSPCNFFLSTRISQNH